MKKVYFNNNFKQNESGNGILEMLLFIPIALVFLFVGIDIGLSYVDKAMLSDAVRETTHEEMVSRVSSTGQSVYQVSAGSVVIKVDLLNQFCQNLANRVSTVIAERRINFLGAGNAVSVKVTPVRIQINTQNGTVSGYTKMSPINSSNGQSSINLGNKIQTISDDNYLNSLFSSNGTTEGYGILATNYSDTSTLYLTETLGLLVTVEALSPSINPQFLQHILDSDLGIQIQDFHVLRS
jgi:Flp pilus assembly protein TadG